MDANTYKNSKKYKDSNEDVVLDYVVLNENTLGYLFKNSGYNGLCFGILGSSVIKHGLGWVRGPYPVSELDTFRKATVEDFDAYRVSHEGYKL